MWTDAQRALLAPPEEITVSAWADQYRILTPKVSAEPGPYRTDRAPYSRAIMDALGDDEHTEVVVMKGAQCGGSELGRNWLAYTIDVDPGPVMVVFPSEQSAKENVEERLLPMLTDSPRLSRFKTKRAWDLRSHQLNLTPCSIYIGWSGSAQALASRPIRYLMCDETDKYIGYRGKEADPISLAKVRTTTFGHRKKVYLVSTPTVADGPISQAFKAAGDRRHYHPKCRKCHKLIPAKWENVRWENYEAEDHEALAEVRNALENGAPVTYRCPECSHKHNQVAWRRATAAGEWVSEDHEPGEHPASDTVAFHITGLVSPWLPLPDLALEFVKAKLRGLPELQNFWNSFLGLPFWDEFTHGSDLTAIQPQTIWRKANEGGAPGLVPEWAVCVLAGADSGITGHHYVVRAYGPGYRSQLLDYGEAADEEDLRQRTLRNWPASRGRIMETMRMCIDSGGGRGLKSTITDRVYRFSKSAPAHIWAIKGYGGPTPMAQPITTREHQYKGQYDVRLTIVDVLHFKDLLCQQINGIEWGACTGVSRDYVMQLCAEQRRMIERRMTSSGVREIWRWMPRAAGAANHYFDAEVYCLVAAYMMSLDQAAAADAPVAPAYKPRRKVGDRWRIGR